MSFHLIIGEDDYLVGEAAKRILSAAAEKEEIDSMLSVNEESQLSDIRAADAAFSTPPFLEPSKATWWRNVGFLPQSGSKKGPSEKVKETLVAFAEKIAANPLPENQIFVISGPRLLMTSVFAKTLKGAGEVISLATAKAKEKSRDAVARAIDGAKERGFAFAPGAADAFVAAVGTDTRSIESELDKMRDYLGNGGTATRREIAEISSPGAGVETPLWELTDAVASRDAAKAVEAAARFSGESGFDVMATTILERMFRNLAELKDAMQRGEGEKAALDIYGSPWTAKKNIAAASKWTLRELRFAWGRFMNLRERAVSGALGTDNLVITEIIRAVRRAV